MRNKKNRTHFTTYQKTQVTNNWNSQTGFNNQLQTYPENKTDWIHKQTHKFKKNKKMKKMFFWNQRKNPFYLLSIVQTHTHILVKSSQKEKVALVHTFEGAIFEQQLLNDFPVNRAVINHQHVNILSAWRWERICLCTHCLCLHCPKHNLGSRAGNKMASPTSFFFSLPLLNYI